MGFSLDDTASDEVGVRVGKIGGNAEHTPDRLGLLLENTERHLVAFLSVASRGFGCGDHRLGVRQRMVWVFGRPIWEQIFRNAGQRRDAFQIAVKTTIAFNRTLRAQQGNQQEIVNGSHLADVGQQIYLKAGMTAVIEAGVQLTLKVGGNFIDISPAGVAIQGTMVMINSGGAAGTGTPSSPVAPLDPAQANPTEPDVADDSKSGRKSARS